LYHIPGILTEIQPLCQIPASWQDSDYRYQNLAQ
jgi:hypothetical protein